MKSRIYARKKSTKEQTPDFSTAPAQPMFQSRSFVVQPKKTEPSQAKDLNRALKRAERYGHNLRGHQAAGMPASTVGKGTREERLVIQKVSNSEQSESEVSNEWLSWAATILGVTIGAILLYLSFGKNRQEQKEKLEETIHKGNKQKKPRKKKKATKPVGEEQKSNEIEESEGESEEEQKEQAEMLESMVAAYGQSKSKGAKKGNVNVVPSTPKATLTTAQAQDKVDRWKKEQVALVTAHINRILNGQGDPWGEVQIERTPPEAAQLALTQQDLKKSVIDEIKKAYPHGGKVQGTIAVGKDIRFYHTTGGPGRGKGGDGFNITGHVFKNNTDTRSTIFNIHIPPSTS